MLVSVTRRRGGRQRILSTLLATGCALATYSLLCSFFTCIGANYEGPLRLLEPYRPPTSDEAAGLIPIEYALTSDAANDIIFVGDSACRSGLDPLLFESLTGLRSYNLGSFGSLGISAYFVTLEAYLAHHSTPRVVVLCVSPTAILNVRSDPDPYGAAIQITTAGTLYERFLRVYGPPSQRRSVFADGTASLRYFTNRGMAISKSAAATHLGGKVPDRLDEPLYGFANESYNTLRDKTIKRRGFFPLPRDHGAGVTIFLPLAEPHSVITWMNDGVREFAKLARSHHFRLLIRLAPLSHNQAPWDSECIPAWLKRLETEFPGVSVSRPEILWYDPEVCWDSIHLNARGVEQFTAKTAKDVVSLVGLAKAAKAQPE